jgi:hypothetical protein
VGGGPLPSTSERRRQQQVKAFGKKERYPPAPNAKMVKKINTVNKTAFAASLETSKPMMFLLQGGQWYYRILRTTRSAGLVDAVGKIQERVAEKWST